MSALVQVTESSWLIVTVTGTDRKLQWDNGWGFWQLSFAQWKTGSTL